MGILRTFIEKLEASGAVAPSDSDEPDQPPPSMAAAEAAIEEAIRQRQMAERRNQSGQDRRTDGTAEYGGPERRKAERRTGGSFGRRTRG